MIVRSQRGQDITIPERVKIRLDQCYVAKLCVSAVDRLFEASGGNALFETNAIQRQHRDVHAASHQVALAWDQNAEMYGRVCLGLEPNGLVW